MTTQPQPENEFQLIDEIGRDLAMSLTPLNIPTMTQDLVILAKTKLNQLKSLLIQKSRENTNKVNSLEDTLSRMRFPDTTGQ